jgi:hypothetical protein
MVTAFQTNDVVYILENIGRIQHGPLNPDGTVNQVVLYRADDITDSNPIVVTDFDAANAIYWWMRTQTKDLIKLHREAKAQRMQ